MSAIRARHRVIAPRTDDHRAIVDPRAVSKWLTPTGTTSRVHAFEARVRGSFRISLAEVGHHDVDGVYVMYLPSRR